MRPRAGRDGAFTVPTAGNASRTAKPGPGDPKWIALGVIAEAGSNPQQEEIEVWVPNPGRKVLYDVLRAANPTQFEILTLKEIRIASGEDFYRLKVRRTRYGTSRLAFIAGDRAWIIRRAALVLHQHASFPAYATSGTTATFRLQARNLFGREADLADTTQCPNRTFAFGSSGLTVSTTLADYVLSWTDNSTNKEGFRIEYSTDGTTWTSAGTVGPGVTSAAIAGPPCDQTVFWRGISFNGAGESIAPGRSPAFLVDPGP